MWSGAEASTIKMGAPASASEPASKNNRKGSDKRLESLNMRWIQSNSATSSEASTPLHSPAASTSSCGTSQNSSALQNKYTCRACGMFFPNWSKCLSHVRSSEEVADPALFSLTTTPEGRRELQKLCKASGDGTDSPSSSVVNTPVTTPSTTPISTPTAANGRGALRSFENVGEGQVLTTTSSVGTLKPTPGLRPLHLQQSVVQQQSHQPQAIVDSIGWLSTSSVSPPTNGAWDNQQQKKHQLSMRHQNMQSQNQQNQALQPPPLYLAKFPSSIRNNIESEIDRASVSSCSSMSMSPDTTPLHSPFGSPRRTPGPEVGDRHKSLSLLSTASATLGRSAIQEKDKVCWGSVAARTLSVAAPQKSSNNSTDQMILLTYHIQQQQQQQQEQQQQQQQQQQNPFFHLLQPHKGGNKSITASSVVASLPPGPATRRLSSSSLPSAGVTTCWLDLLPDNAAILVSSYLELHDCMSLLRVSRKLSNAAPNL